ncbi:MAG: glycosyltransferase family 2 protein [Calditrichia bacterium]
MNHDKRLPTYVLITAARNEAQYIVKTLDSVVNQTILPLRWVIVNDGSTDNTSAIVKEYAAQYPFIKLVTIQRDGDRNFAAKVYAFEKGQQLVQDLQYDFIGNLDADVSFRKDYYEVLINKFKDKPRLGVSGGIIYEKIGDKFYKQNINTRSVAGAIQFFCKDCLESFGGYLALKNGMVDGIAELMARRNHWQTLTFSDLVVFHHRRVGTTSINIFTMNFKAGINQYQLGYLIKYHVLRSISYIFSKPYLLGTICLLSGYFYALISGKPRIIPNDIVTYLRYEQKQFLRSRFKKSLNPAN